MTQTRFDESFEPIAVATRSGFEESLHHGAGVALAADGSITASIGDPDLVVYPRSALKPMQADAMVLLGLDLPAELLAVVCASHSGEAKHLDAVRRILSLHDLAEADLQNTPAYPLDAAARNDVCLAGHGESSLQQNCSGKHAGMLATCRLNGWPLDDYLRADHPLQIAITTRVDELIGDANAPVAHVGVDGCGAPTHTLSLRGLATAFATLARTGSAVAQAMSARPDLVGGTGRDVTTWMGAVPGLIAKEGAAAVMAAATPDGRAIAFKIADGLDTARQAVVVEAMRQIGVDGDTSEWDAVVASVSVPMLGHGHPVGELRPLSWTG